MHFEITFNAIINILIFMVVYKLMLRQFVLQALNLGNKKLKKEKMAM